METTKSLRRLMDRTKDKCQMITIKSRELEVLMELEGSTILKEDYMKDNFGKDNILDKEDSSHQAEKFILEALMMAHSTVKVSFSKMVKSFSKDTLPTTFISETIRQPYSNTISKKSLKKM